MIGFKKRKRETEMEIFCKYFDADIFWGEIWARYYHKNSTIEYLEDILMKMVEIKSSKIKSVMHISVDFAKNVRAIKKILEKKDEFMPKYFMSDMIIQRMAKI